MKKLLMILILCLNGLYGVVYENAEDKSTKRWISYNHISEATIKNIYDKSKRSRVILFQSEDSRNGYMLPMERDSKSWCKTLGKSLKWKMSANGDFVIFVSLQTTNGHRSIIYTPSSDRLGRGYYGLGKMSMDGEWHSYRRDLDLDLKRYEPDNDIIAVDTFFIRGREVKIDDIEIESIKEEKKKDYKPPKKRKECKIYVPPLNDTKKGKSLDSYDSVPPVIKLNGDSTVYLKLGDRYREKGAIALDNVDGRLNVDISGDIDSNRVGTYTLFYMAKDTTGNTSMTTRIINVMGETQNSHKVKKDVVNTPKKRVREKHYIDKQKQSENLDLELALPPEDEALEEFGIVED